MTPETGTPSVRSGALTMSGVGAVRVLFARLTSGTCKRLSATMMTW